MTFLFTDIEGSTRLWEQQPAGMQLALERHDEMVRTAIDARGGYVFTTAGDAFSAAFDRGTDALDTAVELQRRLATEPWAAEATVKVRMGLCVGEAQERGGDYIGPALNRAARLMSLAGGGQILVSDALRQIVVDRLDTRVELIDLGSTHLKDIATPERAWQVRAEGLTGAVGLTRPTGRIGNLRVPASDFVGRGDEMSRLATELERSALVTLTGVGGVGKTRLAVEAGERLHDAFVDGVWITALGAVDDPDAVPHAVATDLGVRVPPTATPTEAITDYLSSASLLWIIDNCEHLLDAVAALVDAVRAECPGVSVPATSREGLGLDGEQVWPVRSLDPDEEGIELFCIRAHAADATFEPSTGDLELIGSICGRLDGIPLAIELAAARAHSLTLTDLAERLDDRFRLLRGARRGGIERHQTLRATVDGRIGSSTRPIGSCSIV